MITRRKMLSSAGILAAGTSLIARAGASSFLSPVSGNAKPLVFVTDERVGNLNLVNRSADALSLASNSSVIQAVLGEDVLASVSKSASWLDSQRGANHIYFVDARYGFILDEVLKDLHARVLFKGEHRAMALNEGPVNHDVLELPVSAGVAASLPVTGAWTEQLMTSLAQVANRVWMPEFVNTPLVSSDVVRRDSARLSLVTYVIEI